MAGGRDSQCGATQGSYRRSTPKSTPHSQVALYMDHWRRLRLTSCSLQFLLKSVRVELVVSHHDQPHLWIWTARCRFRAGTNSLCRSSKKAPNTRIFVSRGAFLPRRAAPQSSSSHRRLSISAARSGGLPHSPSHFGQRPIPFSASQHFAEGEVNDSWINPLSCAVAPDSEKATKVGTRHCMTSVFTRNPSHGARK